MPDLSKYTQQADGTFKCKTCGSDIMAARVAHPVWDGLFPCSGGGDVQYEDVPYCPKCEKEPSFHGGPVYEH